MGFSMRDFVKRGLLNAVGKQADYLIIRNAAGWHEKGVLELSDLEEIQNALNAQGNIVGDVTREFPTPETVMEIPPTDEETSEALQESEDVTQEKPTPETVTEIPPTDEETSGLAPESGGVTDE